jgi:hypothetical protein
MLLSREAEQVRYVSQIFDIKIGNYTNWGNIRGNVVLGQSLRHSYVTDGEGK